MYEYELSELCEGDIIQEVDSRYKLTIDYIYENGDMLLHTPDGEYVSIVKGFSQLIRDKLNTITCIDWWVKLE